MPGTKVRAFRTKRHAQLRAVRRKRRAQLRALRITYVLHHQTKGHAQLTALRTKKHKTKLTNPRHEQVHRGHRFSVLVVPHVEGLDVARVVVDEDCGVVPGLRQPALVLSLPKGSTKTATQRLALDKTSRMKRHT